MESILELMRTDYFYIGVLISIIVLFLLYIVNIIKLGKMKNNYNSFMEKIGDGHNIQENLEKYIKQVEKVEGENNKLREYCKLLEQNVAGCIQKVGLVRYSAFKDTGSDLSFTLALLNKDNTGVVLNGIYSSEISNIYSKPVEKGESSYTLSEEEKQAISKAMNM